MVVPVPGPATSNVVAPVLSLPPTRPAVSAHAEPIRQAVSPGITRESRKPREWPPCSHSSARLAAKNRLSVSHSPARSTASNPTSTLDPAQLAMVPPSEVPGSPLDPVQDCQEAAVPANNDLPSPFHCSSLCCNLRTLVCLFFVFSFSFLLWFPFLVFALLVSLVVFKRKDVVSCRVGQSP